MLGFFSLFQPKITNSTSTNQPHIPDEPLTPEEFSSRYWEGFLAGTELGRQAERRYWAESLELALLYVDKRNIKQYIKDLINESEGRNDLPERPGN